MTQQPRHKIYGRTMSDWISLVPGELPQDAVGLWQILAAGQDGFDLSGADLSDYVRRNIVVLLDHGAIPVKGGKGTAFDWIALHKYGKDKDTVVSAIVSEWEASQTEEMYSFSIWFALPRENVGNLNP